MAWHEAKTRFLRQRSLDPAKKLGEGEESEVYAFGSKRVIRLLKEPTDHGYANRRRAFYERLDKTQVGFEVPSILEQGEHDGVRYSVERRIAGSSLADALPQLEGAGRRHALLAYAETSAAVRKLGFAQKGFGEVLAMPPLRADTWEQFVLSRASTCLAASHHRVAGQVDRPDRALARLERLLTLRPKVTQGLLVHGDYYPANVMVDSEGQVTGVIDFGPLTVMGDAQMDAAGAVLYLTGMAGVTAQDRQTILTCIQEQGLSDMDLALYRLFYAFRFLHTPREGLFRWCIETIRSAC